MCAGKLLNSKENTRENTELQQRRKEGEEEDRICVIGTETPDTEFNGRVFSERQGIFMYIQQHKCYNILVEYSTLQSGMLSPLELVI